MGLFAACAFRDQRSNVESEQEQQQQFQDDDQYVEEEEDDDESEWIIDEDTGLAHPGAPTRASTRRLINIFEQPDPEKTKDCVESIYSFTDGADNSDTMLEVLSQVKQVVEKDIPLHHWCYYQMVAALDNRLARGGPLMDDLALIFFKRVRILWVFAKALSAVSEDPRYYKYLKIRYIQISRDTFGRTIRPLGPGLGEPKRKVDPPRNKPADRAEVE